MLFNVVLFADFIYIYIIAINKRFENTFGEKKSIFVYKSMTSDKIIYITV